ncbi:MAG: hypothetical protein ACRETL_10320, partial [Gammaproteobacteria bacterium]
MSIQEEIEHHVTRGALVEIGRRDLRARADAGYRRRVYVSASLNQEMVNRRDEPSFRRLSVILQNFTIGMTIPVALEQPHRQA